MRALSTILLIIAVPLPVVIGQVSTWDLKAENFKYRIKNIEFFIDRFNNQSDGHGSNIIQIPFDSLDHEKFIEQRDAAILSLFDLSKLKKADKKLKQKINSFIVQVNHDEQPQFLNFTDTDWFVTFLLHVTVSGAEKIIQCKLSLLPIGHQQHAWVIQSLQSPQLNLQENFEGTELYFPPNANGTDFMGVRLHLNDPAWTSEKLSILPDQSSFTIAKLNSSEMIIDAISNITYHFLQVNGWLFTVKYINRESRNSGWLMDNLTEATESEKSLYRERFFVTQVN